MKKMFLSLLAGLFILSGSLFAQNQRSVQEVASMLENADVFIKYRKFRGDFQQMNVELGGKLKYYEDYDKLNLAYNEVQGKYNEFLEVVRKDLSDWKEIKNMARYPASYADKYLEEYNSVINVYNKSYQPLYNKILAEANVSKGKSITPQMILMGIEVFAAVVDLIKGRKEEKEANLSLIIGMVNDHFYNKLRMKDWAELDIPVPQATRPASPTPQATSTSTDGAQNRNGAVPTVVTQVSAPLFSDMRGFVEFHYLDYQDLDQKMNFIANKGKNITVSTRVAQNGGIQTQTTTNRVDYYNSSESFRDGDQFYLKVNNSAGMYVLTLNSDGTISFLYPFDAAATASNGNKGKNITVEGRDRNNVTTLPAPDKGVTPPKQRFFTFTGPATRESFCVLLTRSDLDVNETRRALEARQGEDLHNRLAAVFGNKLVQPSEAGIMLEGNRLNFDASATEATVLPVVFYINRK